MEIACTDLVVEYPLADRGVRALDGVSCSVQSGEIVVIVGRSGSGKTTLLNVMGGLERPTSGRVEVDGIDVYAQSDRWRSEYRNARVGFVFQSFHLNPHDTTTENVSVPFLFSRQRVADQAIRARTVLEAVDLGPQAEQRAGTLSAGQRQRVAIARALVNQPEFVFADEPTGNLDEETGSGIIRRLEALARESGLGVVIVTHDAEITRIADRVLRLERGVLA